MNIKLEYGALIRLYNSSSERQTTALEFKSKTFNVDFGSFEVKTFIANGGKLSETDMLGK